MKRSSERILTTHAGALPQPADLKQMHTAQMSGAPVDADTFAKRVREVVAEVVKKQLDCGLDIINDGEVGKSNFSRYARERLSGFIEREVKPDAQICRSTRVATGDRRFQSRPTTSEIHGGVSPCHRAGDHRALDEKRL